MALQLKSKKTMELIENEKSKGGRADYFDPKPNDKGVFKIFICPPKNEDTPIVQKVKVHEIFNKTGKVAGVTSPANFEEKDPFIKIGWDLKAKYAEHKNEKIKDFFKYLVGKDKNIMYIIDPSNIEKGIQMYQAPKAVIDFVLNEIENSEDGSIDFAHPKTGKFLIIKKTGVKLLTKYQCAWGKNNTNLEGIDEDKLEEMLNTNAKPVIGGLFKKPTKEQLDTYKEAIDVLAEKVGISINWKNTKDSNLEVDDDAELDTDLDTEGDGLSGDDEDLDLTDDEKPKDNKKADAGKKTDAKAGGKKAAKDDDDDLDMDDLDLD